MPISPLAQASDILTVTIKVDGAQIKDSYNIYEVLVERRINAIPSAVIRVLESDTSNEPFIISQSKDFEPGKAIEILAGYNQKEKSLFKGIIARRGIEASLNSTAILEIHCQDKAVTMTDKRKHAQFLKKSVSEAIAKVISNSGLKKDVEATKHEQAEIIQLNSTDWDFILHCAKANGLLVNVVDGTVSVRKPVATTSPELVVTYGEDLRSINLQETHDLMHLADEYQLDPSLLSTRGTVSFQGTALPQPATLLQLDGLNKRFNGNVFISSVTHSIAQGEWETNIGFGLSPDWFAEKKAAKDTSATASNTEDILPKSDVIWSYDDDNKVLHIKTPGGHTFTMDDKDESITVTDSNKNSIELSEKGIKLGSKKDISIKASGKIILDAGAGIKQVTKADVSIDGVNITAKAKASLTAEGQASASLKASGKVTVQGAIVMIN